MVQIIWRHLSGLGHIVPFKGMMVVITHQTYSDLVFVVQRLEDPVEHCAWGLWTHGKMTSCLCFVRWHTHASLQHVVHFPRLSLFPSGASEGRPDCVWEVPTRAWRRTKSAGTTPLLPVSAHDKNKRHLFIQSLNSPSRTFLERWQMCWRK